MGAAEAFVVQQITDLFVSGDEPGFVADAGLDPVDHALVLELAQPGCGCEQILDAATRAFARAGYSATGLDDVVGEAGITRVILYRRFESKPDMYRAVLDRACVRQPS